MALKDELENRVSEIFKEKWEEYEPDEVPAPEDLGLWNEAAKFERATVLYADLSSSTDMVDSKQWGFSAEVYKTYLYCATRLIRNAGGTITSYDGDRVMGVFVGQSQSTPAAKCALKINWAVQNIINPKLKAQYPTTDFVVKQVVGVDTSLLRAARTGVRGDNDVVWVGRAANYAAKLTSLKVEGIRSWVTKSAYDKMTDEAKYSTNGNQPMWKQYKWTQFGDREIYGSSWSWEI
jgi:class 3 adenylate cyclase